MLFILLTLLSYRHLKRTAVHHDDVNARLCLYGDMSTTGEGTYETTVHGEHLHHSAFCAAYLHTALSAAYHNSSCRGIVEDVYKRQVLSL